MLVSTRMSVAHEHWRLGVPNLEVADTMSEWSDDDLLAAVKDLSGSQVPPGAADAAMGLFTWRTVDAELAVLTADSVLEAPAGVRGASEARTLTFATQDVQVVVEITESAGRRQLLGQLVPGRPGQVSVRQGAAVRTVEADHLGRFVIDDLGPRAPLSLRCSWGDGAVSTDWVLV